MAMWLLEWLNEARTWLYYAGAVAVPVLHVALAVSVALDLRRRQQRGLRPVLLPAAVWTLAALTGGLLALAVYWLAHHSSLRGAAMPAPDNRRDFNRPARAHPAGGVPSRRPVAPKA